ncbi:MAG TPA: TRAP transporter small permease [Burkholderiales bacterium]|jgi:TRAP-type C4-dicarboxylate transport system permease small subunit
MQGYVRAMRTISQLCGFVAAGLIAAGVVVVCEMVTLRYVFGESTIWQTDFTTYCLIGATFVGSPYVLMTRGHVNVDILPHYMGAKARRRLAFASSFVTIAFALILAVLTFNFWMEAWEQRWVSDTMWRARLWIPYSSMPIGLTLLTLQAIAELIQLVRRQTTPFGLPDAEHLE